MRLRTNADRAIPIRRPLTEPLTHAIEGGGVDRARARIRESAGRVGTDPSTVAQIIEDLTRSGYRPLRSPGPAALSSSTPAGAACGGGHPGVKGPSFGGVSHPVEEDEG